MNDAQTLRTISGFLRPFAGRIVLSIALSAATIGSAIALMMTSAWLISIAGLQLGITSLGIAPTGVRLFGVSRAVFRYLERLVSHDVTFRLLAQFRVWFYERIEPLAPAGLAQYRSGDLMARVVSDVEELQNFFIRVVSPPLVAIAVTVAMTLAFLAFDVWAALTLLAFMVVAGTLIPYLAWWQGRNPGRALVAARADLNTALIDQIQGMADSMIYGQTSAQLTDFRRINTQLADEESRLARLDGLQSGLFVMLTNLAAVSVLIVAIPRVEGVYLATLALGTIAAFEALMPLGVAAQHLSGELAAARRLFDVLDVDNPVKQTGTQTHLPDDTTLSIERMTFRYAPDLPPVFDQFALTVTPGEWVALVGQSGAGKSTLVNALLRHWDYSEGVIRIGDTDLRDFDLSAIRDLFGVMSQRTHLFNTTIKENIKIANKHASDEAVIAAAKQAQIHDFIEALPDGYDTYVGENGAALSGGERQRIALARVILKDAPIWILDEATANLDADTESRVMKAIYQAAEGRTLLIITHRLPVLSAAVRVINL